MTEACSRQYAEFRPVHAGVRNAISQPTGPNLPNLKFVSNLFVHAELVYAASEDTALCEIAWIDLLPTYETKLYAQLSAAADALLT